MIPTNLSCTWTIHAADNFLIKLSPDPRRFSIKELLVFDGNISTKILRYTGEYTSQTSVIRLKYTEEQNIKLKGFRLYYSHIPCPVKCDQEYYYQCEDKLRCYRKNEKCDGYFHCSDGSDEECNNIKLKPFLTCGRPLQSPLKGGGRVIGGEKAIPGSWPWMAFIAFKAYKPIGKVCSGVLIDRNWVLTAAHCFIDISNQRKLKNDLTSELEIYFGRYNAIIPNKKWEIVRYIKEFHFPPIYENIIADIALIELSSPVPLDNPYVSPACLPDVNIDYNGLSGYAVGWGDLDAPLFLQQVNVPIVDISACKRIWNSSENIYLNYLSEYICAGSIRNDACKGDSGGPLMLYDENQEKWVVIGIVSLGASPCGHALKPGIYTKVSAHLDWIHKKI